MARPKRHADGQTHHPPKTVEQQSEDSFPASDPPSFSGGDHIVGAPSERKTRRMPDEQAERVHTAHKKAKSGKAKAPDSY